MGKQRHSEERNLTDVAKISQGRLRTRDILVDTKRLAREKKDTINTQWGHHRLGERCLGALSSSIGIEGHRRHMRHLLDKVKAFKLYTKTKSVWRSSLGD